MLRYFIALLFTILLVLPSAAGTTILVLGDSLSAGYGLEPGHAMPDVLQAALRKSGKDITLINAGVSGDTAAQGAARFEWALTPDVKAIILELGSSWFADQW